VHRFPKVDGFKMGLGDGGAVEGAAQRLGGLLADPLTTDETLQDLGHGELSGKWARPTKLTNRAVGKF